MPYSPTTWINDTPPPLSAANLNKLTDELESQAAAQSISHTLPNWIDGSGVALTDAIPLNEMERVIDLVAASLSLPYTPTTWQTGWIPARNAANFNKMEVQSQANRAALDAVPPSTGKIGVVFFRWGSGAPPPTHQADYDEVWTSWSGAEAGGRTIEKRSIVYMSILSLIGGQWGAGVHAGVPLDQARANDWVLKDAGGNDVMNQVYGVPVGDMGSAGYQAAWCANVEAKLNEWGYDGVFIDDTLRHYNALTSGQVPVKYPDMPSWEDANVSFAQAIQSHFQPLGKYVIYNATGFYSEPNPDLWYEIDTGGSDLYWWGRLAPYTDGLLSEYSQWHEAILNARGGNNGRRYYGNGPDGVRWMNSWAEWQRLPAFCETAGIDYHGGNYSTDVAQANYSICSVLLETRGSVGWAPGGANDAMPDPWHSLNNQLMTLGDATGSKYQSGDTWYRQYEGGLVWVNPVTGTAGIS